MTHHFADDIRAFFQPLVGLDTRTVQGFEALARFGDGAPPPVHLANAEAAGLREELELRLIEIAVRNADRLPSDTFVTLNASASTMLRPELVGILGGTTRHWGLELYESSPVERSWAVRARLSSLGVFLLIDDAGAGLADEARIFTLRPDVVKIDRELFWKALAGGEARDRVRSLVAAAREIEARVLVEGIEDSEQLDAARRFGADLGQGYHLGRPTPPAGIGDMLADLRRRLGVGAAGL